MNCTRNAGIYTAVLAIIMMVSAVMIPVADVSAEEEKPVDTCDIIYVVNSTAFNFDDVAIDKEGKVITLLTKLPEGASAPIGQEFKGWMYNSKIVESINDAEKDKTYTVTAVFSVIEYKVTFIANGVSATTEYNYNEAVAVPEKVAKVAAAPGGYSFAGWSNGIAILTEFPAVTGDVTYVAVYEIDVVPVETFTVTFMIGDEVYSTQTVESIEDVIILPYIDGYSWGEAVIDAEGNAIITAIADPIQPENSFGITNTELAIIIGAFLLVIVALFVIAYKLGFIEIGKKGAVKE